VSAQHFRGLERLYAAAPINALYRSRLEIPEAGRATIRFEVEPAHFHAAGAAHGTLYFKMLDDAAFYAANSLVEDLFVLTTQFSLFLTRPVTAGPLVAHAKWVSGRRRVLIAEAHLVDGEGEEVARGTGSFMRSRIPLASLPGYATGETSDRNHAA